MIEFQNATINTAGAYIGINGLYVFAMGIKPHQGNIPIIRLGGHREENETGWQCVVREVYEEASLEIKPIMPMSTYLYDGNDLGKEFQEIPWQFELPREPSPILVGAYSRKDRISLSLMYLAESEGLPVPSSEVKGLVLLEEAEIHRLCREPITLEQYLNSGGTAILNSDFDKKHLLEPFTQLRLLSRLLSIQNQSAP